MPIIVIIVLLVLLLGDGGTYYGQRSGWGGPHYGGGLLGLILLSAVDPLAHRQPWRTRHSLDVGIAAVAHESNSRFSPCRGAEATNALGLMTRRPMRETLRTPSRQATARARDPYKDPLQHASACRATGGGAIDDASWPRARIRS